MNKSTLFTKAHAIARNTAKFVGNYSIAFSFALKEVYKMTKQAGKTNQHFNDDVFNVLTGALAMIKTLSKGSQVYAKKACYEIARKYIKEFGVELSKMKKWQIEEIEEEISIAIR